MSDFADQLRSTLQIKAPRHAAADQRAETQAEITARAEAMMRHYAEADARAASLSQYVFQPLLREFQEVLELESGVVFSHGWLQDGRVPRGAHWASYTGSDAGAGTRLYYVRFSALAYRDGPLLLAAECCHDAARACRTRVPKTPLLEFEPRTVLDARIDDDDARRWCSERLWRSAEAIMEAVFSTHAARAPIPALPPLVALPLGTCDSVPSAV